MSGLLDRLEQAAQQATPGPWFVAGPPWNNTAVPYVIAGSEDPHAAEYVCDVENVTADDQRPTLLADAQFIAAANPATVLALTRAVRAAIELAAWMSERGYVREIRGWEPNAFVPFADALAPFVGDKDTA